MEEITAFSENKTKEKLQVLLDSLKNQQVLYGEKVERIFRRKNCTYIFFTSDDSPYEEALYITLVDSIGQVIESVELMKPYSPGILKDLIIRNDQNIEFKFWGESINNLIIADKKKVHFSHIIPSNGVRYSNKLSPSYLTIKD
ncbi:hypothetical protein OIZ54_12460 [Pseudoalteromonas sp. A3]|uniref:hypothetical protein n=1 Tax=Pseudoalteromonas sp. A3 TaxID=142792 RepID=UPI00221FB8D6|nr:hypothetical protein [Pseudoalteromonas sp. A3]MCW1719556.1 hypothetical protein [Pseudoalteromonas sp. A3]